MSEQDFSPIIVPVDGSDHAGHAAAKAAALAKATGARVILVFAFPSSASALLQKMGFSSIPAHHFNLSTETVEQAVKQSADKAFSAARAAMGETSAEEVIVRGEIADAILDYARDANAELIVMGSRGLSALDRFRLGSVSDRVVHHASCPVMVVH